PHFRSTHNTRIERLWVEVGTQFARRWRGFFHRLERCHHLNQSNKHHLWLLQYLFVGDINNDCDAFRNEWNSHPISGEGHNQSPNDMRFMGLLEHGAYKDAVDGDDEYQNVSADVLQRYYGTTQHVRHERPSTGAGNPPDEEDEDYVVDSELSSGSDDSDLSDMEDDIAQQIAEENQSNFHAKAVKAPRHRNPFSSEHESELFRRTSSALNESGYIPESYNLRPEEWDEDGYPAFEIIRTGRTSTKELRVSLPDEIWRPRALQWVQALDIMTAIIERRSMDEDSGDDSMESFSDSEGDSAREDSS
ncbi:hypothetical protein C8J56DRAFT_810197, partial [Mycena floridula]